MNPLRLFALAALVPVSLATAQQQVDLTRKPEAVITDPFTSIAGVRELPGNVAVVTDQMEHALFLANFATKAVSPIGRQGEGPAEYRFPLVPLAGLANTTWVVDATLRRALTISAEGKIVASVATPTGGLAAGVVAARGSDRSGRLYFEGNSFDPQRGSFSDSVAIVRWNPKDNQTAILGRVWSGGRVIINRPEGKASLARSITPFPALDAWAVRPSGEIVIVHHDPFRIDVVDTAGVIHAGTPIAYQAIAITARDRDAYRKKVAFVRSGALLKNGGTGPQRSGQTVGDEEFPQAMPAFVATAVVMSPEGELWIGRSFSAGEATWRYDIFDATGRLAGAATLSANARIVGFGAGVVYVARTDPADDLVYLERHRR